MKRVSFPVAFAWLAVRSGRSPSVGVASITRPSRERTCAKLSPRSISRAARLARQRAARVVDECGEVLGAEAQILIEGVIEVAAQARVDEEAAAREHERHRHREGGGEADADGQAPHGSSSLRRR